jgi:Asp-tRNA(Asn)/Glu-tRNA(Gln) amidotransferase C subunit
METTGDATREQITIEDVQRILDVGRLLFSVLTPEEIEQMQSQLQLLIEIGNTGDS